MGRQKTTTLNLRINEELRERIKALAEKNYLSLSSMAHMLLSWGADKFENRSENAVILSARQNPSLTEIKTETVPVRSVGSVGRPRPNGEKTETKTRRKKAK